MSHNINAVPAKIENSFVTLSSVQVEQTKVEEKHATLVEQASKIELNEKLALKKEDAIESQYMEEATEVEVEDAIEVVSSFINSTLKQVSFSHDNTAGRMIITMIDKETQEVINQFPSEKVISMAGRIKELHQEVESISGLLIDSIV